jgi:hypothetical protein
MTKLSRLLSLSGIFATILFSGCATYSQNESPQPPKLAQPALKIVYVFSTLGRSSSPLPTSTSSLANAAYMDPSLLAQTTSRLMDSLEDKIAKGLQGKGWNVESKHIPGSDFNGSVKNIAFSDASKEWQTLIVKPIGAVKACNGYLCTLRYQLSFQLLDAKGIGVVWSDEVRQTGYSAVTEYSTTPSQFAKFSEGVASFLVKKLDVN